jgi:hypothetical protein
MQTSHSDDFEVAIDDWASAVEGWSAAALNAAQIDADFRSWEGSQKHARMLAGSSAAKAEVEIKAMPDWKDRYLEAVNSQIRTEKWKKALRLAEASFEAERSRQSTLRQVR